MRIQENSELISDCIHKVRAMLQYGQAQLGKLSIPAVQSELLACTKFCIYSTLHRGYYHPSPVYDLIVGNTKRGRLQSNMTDYVSHQYFYNASGRLERIESFSCGRTAFIELLQYQDGIILGTTLDSNGRLAAVCEEVYEDDRITTLYLVNCFFDGNQYVAYDYRREKYIYDDIGISACDFVSFSPQSKNIIHKTYEFQREDGYLVSFSEMLQNRTDVKVTKYQITKKRKA